MFFKIRPNLIKIKESHSTLVQDFQNRLDLISTPQEDLIMTSISLKSYKLFKTRLKSSKTL